MLSSQLCGELRWAVNAHGDDRHQVQTRSAGILELQGSTPGRSCSRLIFRLQIVGLRPFDAAPLPRKDGDDAQERLGW